MAPTDGFCFLSDIDECALPSGGHACSYSCTNVPGTYYCTCPPTGYILAPNGQTCLGLWTSHCLVCINLGTLSHFPPLFFRYRWVRCRNPHLFCLWKLLQHSGRISLFVLQLSGKFPQNSERVSAHSHQLLTEKNIFFWEKRGVSSRFGLLSDSFFF